MPVTVHHLRLYVNVDHVATLRQARGGTDPDPVAAAAACERAGADGITAHLREDRRHIQDADIERLMHGTRTVFNLEMACTDEMLRVATQMRPYQATLVPERRQEVTTEGGLDVARDPGPIADAVRRLRDAGIRASLFIDPDADIVARSHGCGAQAIELHTGAYALAGGGPGPELDALRRAARLASGLGLAVHAGHGLTVGNVGPVAGIPEIEELNIGHAIVSRAIFVGIVEAVHEMRVAMDAGRSSH